MSKLFVLVIGVVIFVSFVSCTDEYEAPVFERVDTVENIEFNTTYSVEGLKEITIYLSSNEEYDRVSFRTGVNAFNEKDCLYVFIQNSAVTVSIPEGVKICKFELRSGVSPEVNLKK